jgi:antitoxin component YwqK of YwqJK toxin-antitoxin module
MSADTDGGHSGTGRFKDGEKTGRWTYWYRNNQLTARGSYAHGKLDGSWVW